jgi:hypothetical protein
LKKIKKYIAARVAAERRQVSVFLYFFFKKKEIPKKEIAVRVAAGRRQVSLSSKAK